MSGHTTEVKPMYLSPTEIIAAFLPMGLSEDAILEIKCPYNSAIHLKNFTITDADSLKSLHPEYFWQMQLGMLATDLPKGVLRFL
jgi:hypothetical protein